MASDNDTYSLPAGPSDLCFDTNEFVKKTFSTDKFLQNHSRKANLETMRDDLGIYLKVLRSAMIELINKDYADFVNLSSNLIGLDKAINGIQVPLGQLKEEVLQVKLSLDEAIADIDTHLETRRELLSKKRSLQNLSRVQKSLTKLSSLLHLDSEEEKESGEKLLADSALVERAASEYNQLQFCISKCTNFLIPYHNKQTDKIRNLLISSLDEMFLKSVRSQDADGTARCLRIYVTMDKIAEVEILFRKEVVSPTMDEIINEPSLLSDPRGLQGVYSRVLEFVHKHMKELLELTAEGVKPSNIKGFDFLVKSYWTEVEQRLEMHLSSIYAPGNPEMFYQRYSETLEFLENFERLCGTQTKVKMLRAHPQYVAFLQRWNLPVYFQIRFQEIAGSLEAVLSEDDSATLLSPRSSGGGGFQLLATSTTWDCLLRCWVDGVFLRQLTHRFWKLSLQIIARYYTWTEWALEKKWPTSSAGTPANGSTTTDVSSSENKKLSFLVNLYADIEKLVVRLPEFLKKASERMTSLSSQNRGLISESLKESELQLLSRLPTVTQFILGEVSSRSLVQLRQVSDIPRLFRRTNREVPTKPCSYVALLLSPPIAFHQANQSTVKPEVLQQWLALIFAAITQQFYSSVSDVLTSVQKTEESLRRLKKIRDRSAATVVNEGRGAGDDDKIRQQLAIDVLSFCDGVESLGVARGKVDKLEDLVSLVEVARTKSDTNKQ